MFIHLVLQRLQRSLKLVCIYFFFGWTDWVDVAQLIHFTRIMLEFDQSFMLRSHVTRHDITRLLNLIIGSAEDIIMAACSV